MKSGYELRWTTHALIELEQTFEYLEKNWTKKELQRLSVEMEQKIKLITQNPYLFQTSDEDMQIRRAVVLRFNSIYYRVQGGQIEIISFYANRKNPDNKKLD